MKKLTLILVLLILITSCKKKKQEIINENNVHLKLQEYCSWYSNPYANASTNGKYEIYFSQEDYVRGNKPLLVLSPDDNSEINIYLEHPSLYVLKVNSEYVRPNCTNTIASFTLTLDKTSSVYTRTISF